MMKKHIRRVQDAAVADRKTGITMPAVAKKYGMTVGQVIQLMMRDDYDRRCAEDMPPWQKSDARLHYVKYKYKRRGTPDFGDPYGVEITSTPEQMAREIG